MSSYDWQPIETRPMDGQGFYLKADNGAIYKLECRTTHKDKDDLRDAPTLIEGEEQDLPTFIEWSAL